MTAAAIAPAGGQPPRPNRFRRFDVVPVWEPERPPPVLAIEVVSSGHPYKDYSWVEGYAAMGALELLVFDPLLLGPKSLGPVTLQLWRRDLTGAFERVHFGDTAEAAQSRAEAAQSKAEAERERAQRLELEAKLRKLEGR